MEAYLVDVEETLSDLTQENGLGVKIASDVADCCKLDLLKELDDCGHAVKDVARVVDIVKRNTWNDVRIASTGMNKLRSLQDQNQQGQSFGRKLLETDGFLLLLQNMRQHPFQADLQRTAAEILRGVLASSSSLIDTLDAVVKIEIANCLVNILKNHHATDELNTQKTAVTALKAALPAPNKRRVPAIIAAIGPAGGIPFLVGVVTKFGAALNEDHPDQDVFISTLEILISIFDFDESRGLFFDYMRFEYTRNRVDDLRISFLAVVIPGFSFIIGNGRI